MKTPDTWNPRRARRLVREGEKILIRRREPEDVVEAEVLYVDGESRFDYASVLLAGEEAPRRIYLCKLLEVLVR